MRENITLETIQNLIYEIRGVKVMLDVDLAQLYKVETKVLNQSVKRNIKRFPKDFLFQLSNSEFDNLKSQFVTSRWGGTRKLPFVFTEQGVAMLSGLLNSDIAINVNIQIMRAFVEMRHLISDNAQIFKRIETIEYNQLTLQQGHQEMQLHQSETDKRIERVFQLMEQNNNIPPQGIFCAGQIFDAYAFSSNLIKSAKESIMLIDNYIDETVFTLLGKRNKGVTATIYTHSISRQLKLDLEKYNTQYEPIRLEEIKNVHDRFLIIDNDVYHIGASLKDLGKKLFAFSKMELEKKMLGI